MARTGFVFLVSLAVAATIGTDGAAAQESPNFVMKRVSLAGGAARLASADFEASLVVGQESPQGGSSLCNFGYTNSAGFWSVLGDLPTPIRLDIVHDDTNPDDIDLLWTGSVSVFQVHRDFSPESVVAPGNLYTETMECSLLEDDTIAADVIYYRVVPKP